MHLDQVRELLATYPSVDALGCTGTSLCNRVYSSDISHLAQANSPRCLRHCHLRIGISLFKKVVSSELASVKMRPWHPLRVTTSAFSDDPSTVFELDGVEPQPKVKFLTSMVRNLA